MKRCSKCGIEKPLDEFQKRKASKDGYQSQCKVCRNKANKEHADKTREYQRKRTLRWYYQNRKRALANTRRNYEANQEKIKRRRRERYAEDPSIDIANRNKRRAIEKSLPSDFNGKQWLEILQRFDGKCAISDSKDIVVEHVIPLAWGHMGTHINNCVPMDASLNSSKMTKNIFAWVKEPEVQERVDMNKFEELIEYLAVMNDLTTQEYREFVYWCEANKRTIDEAAADPRLSVEIWKEQGGIANVPRNSTNAGTKFRLS
jgi:hypothetical protein